MLSWWISIKVVSDIDTGVVLSQRHQVRCCTCRVVGNTNSDALLSQYSMIPATCCAVKVVSYTGTGVVLSRRDSDTNAGVVLPHVDQRHHNTGVVWSWWSVTLTQVLCTQSSQ